MAASPLITRKIITIQRPSLWLLSGFFIVLMLLLLNWLAYEHGRNVAGFDRMEATAVMDELHRQILELEQENDEIQQHNAMLERNSQIDEDAGKYLEDTFSETQSDIQELKKELEFYKSIVSPEQSKRSLVIQAIQVIELEDGRFRYKLTISQKGRNDKLVRGSLSIAVIGHKQEQPVTLKLSEISDEKKQRLKFGFKYFQNFEGTMRLPESFWPEYVRVQVKPKLRSIDAMNEQYAWSDLTAGEMKYVGQ